MEYEGSIGFVSRKMIFFIANFHVLGLVMAKKHDLSEKFFAIFAVERKICATPTA
jgi:hypothetical protein